MKFDNYDRKILALLHDNARITMKELSEKVHLSQPTCTERVKRLEEAGIIERHTVQVNYKALGFGISAIVRIRPLPGALAKVEQLLQEVPEITSCYKVTGDDCYICLMHVAAVNDLDECLSRITQIATTNTSIIKATLFRERLLTPFVH